MISPSNTRKYIQSTGADYGQNVTLPDTIDKSQCREFFGTRCPDNVHVKGDRVAHIDRVDPRKNPFAHLKKDVGIPYSVMGASLGAIIGGIAAKNNRKKGLVAGAVLGAIVGQAADMLDDALSKR